jgi:tyramine---L-glutamate ligase
MVMGTPTILVHEYFSGGGWPDRDLPKELVVEGLSMLQAVLADFSAWNEAFIITTRDLRLTDISLTADHIVDLDPNDHLKTLARLARKCNAAFIIAPESDGILESLNQLVASQGVHLLGSSPDAIALAANKWECHQRFCQASLSTPDTWLVNIKQLKESVNRFGFPLIIKPVDGIGCEGIHLIRDKKSLLVALESVKNNEGQLLLQRYIEGQHISAALLLTENSCNCLSLNKQFIKIDNMFNYQGGEVPFNCNTSEEIVNLAKLASETIPGLKGYIGVDMLLTDTKCYLIEINPRLTTSYIGLRQVANINLAEAIWNASWEGRLPNELLLSGKFVFNKEDLV